MARNLTKRTTLGGFLWQLTLSGLKFVYKLVKRRPSLAVSVSLHLTLLILLGMAFSMPDSQPPRQYFLPAPDNLPIQDEIDPLLPPDPEDISDDDSSTENVSNKDLSDNSAGSSASTMPEAPNLIVAAGVNSLFQMPSGNGTDLQGMGAGGSGGGGGKGLAKARKKMGNLFGLDVGSGNQGLIIFLDKSGSMEKVAEQVQALVEQEFPDAKVFNLRGALFGSAKSLEKLRSVKKADPYILSYYQSMLNGSIIPKCIDYLQTTKTNPESIYMLSDFADYIDFAALNEFCDMLVARKIKFFAHSLDKSPPYAINRVCQVTSGAVLVLPANKLPQPSHEK
jgi:hypothetical protein